MMPIISLGRVAEQPWRNGGGSTRELLAWPTAADWLLRISVAEITQDGPFSAYPGVERWFAVLSGAGVVLRFPDRREVLDEHSAPLRFDGDEAPQCDLSQGPTRDLNLMLQRAAGSGGMRVATPDEDWISPAPLRAAFSAGAARLQVDDSHAAQLPPMSLAWSDAAAQRRWRLLGDTEPVRGWWLWFESAREQRR